MITIAITSLKGGVGKSTLALNLAAEYRRAGHRTLLIDCDPQRTLCAWSLRAAESEIDGPPVVFMDARTLRRDIAKVSEGFDVVLIDCPPRMGAESRAAMIMSDMVLMPTVHGAADVWALGETIDVFKEACTLRPELRGAIVFNRSDRTSIATLARKAVATHGVRVLDDVISARVAFAESMLSGRGVVDYEPQGTAAREVRAVARAVVGCMSEAA